MQFVLLTARLLQFMLFVACATSLCPTVIARTDTLVLERQKSEDAALARWPEIGDPKSIFTRELRRLLEEYETRGDARLQSADAPIWLASQAAANTASLRHPGEAQQSAMRLYPDLAVLDSPLNKLFRENYARLKEVDPAFFHDARWPIKLGRQCALQLDAERAVRTPSLTAMQAEEKAPTSTAAGSASLTPEIWSNARRVAVIGVWALAAALTAWFTLRFALRTRRNAPHSRDDWSI